MRTVGWLAIVVIGAAACADPQGVQDSRTASAAPAFAAGGADGVHQTTEREALRAADLAHAAAAATGAAGFLGYLSDDALFLLPRSPLAVGKAAAAALLAAPPFPFASGMKLLWTPSFADVSVDARVGYTFGHVSIVDGGVPDVIVAQYIAFWRRQDGGDWKAEVWSLTGAGAEPGALPPFFGHPLDNGHGNFTPVDMAAEKQRLLGVDAAFSQASVDLGSALAFKMFADPHAITLNGGDPDFTIGRKAIYESRLGAPPDFVLSWTPHFAGVGPLGDLGYTVGNYVASQTAGTGFGKYLTIWQKSPNGTWKFVQDGGSSTPPPVAP